MNTSRAQSRQSRYKGELIDESLNPLAWYIDKQNRYVDREAADPLDLEYGFLCCRGSGTAIWWMPRLPRPSVA